MFCESLQQQVQKAQTLFPELWFGNNQVIIEFNEKKRMKFIINFPQTFPNQPPTIQIQTDTMTSTMQPPITTYWVCVYTVTDILNQLKEYSSLPSNKHFTITQQEVYNALSVIPQQQLMDPQQRQNALQQIKSIQTAERTLSTITNKVGNLTDQQNKNRQQLEYLRNQTNQIINQKNQLQAQMYQNGPNQVQKQVQAYQKHSDECDKKAQKCLNDFKSGNIDITQFLEQFQTNKEEANKYKIMAQNIQARGY